jgi:hypothetical protein
MIIDYDSYASSTIRLSGEGMCCDSVGDRPYGDHMHEAI